MKQKLLLVFLGLLTYSLGIRAQSITVGDAEGTEDCYANRVADKTGTTIFSGITRNTFTGTLANGTPFRVIYTSGRWEVQSDPDKNGSYVFTDYYNNFQSHPDAPSLTTGIWVNLTGGACGSLTNFSGTGTQTTLPVELLSFDAQNTEGGTNTLTWRTASEKNNRHFDIERSTDGSTFHSIGQVKGNNKPSSYQFVDNQPFVTSYYRLRQIDFDGTETVSKVVSIAQKGKGKGLTIYPNPVSNTLTVENTEGANFQILNLLGQQVLTGKTGQRLDVSALPQGTYVLKVGAEQVKFVKQ